MPIVYALVARRKVVLAEYTSSTGNFPTVTRVLLAKIPETDSRMSYVYDKHVFHYIVDQGITFLCMSDEGMKRRTTFAFLEDIKSAWRERFTSVEQSAIAFSLNDAFSPILRQKIDFHNANPNADNIGRVQAQIDEVKDVMIENIDRVLERGEKIELLVDKTRELSVNAQKFEKSSKTLKNAMWYRKMRNYCIIFTVIGILIIIFVMVGCGVSFDNCKK